MPSALTRVQSSQAKNQRRLSPDDPASLNQSGAGGGSAKSEASGLGLLLLLLAALPYEMGITGGDNALETEGARRCNSGPSLAHTANLRYAANTEDVMRAGRRLLDIDFNDFDDDLDDDNDAAISEEERRRRRKRKFLRQQRQALVGEMNTVSGSVYSGVNNMQFVPNKKAAAGGSSSSDNDNDSYSHNSQYTDEVHSFASSESVLCYISAMGADCMTHVMGYLPLKDLTQCRSVSHQFQMATERDTPSPLHGSVFMRFEETGRSGSKYGPAPHHLFKWRCNYCSTENKLDFTTCRQCHGGKGDASGVCKVFLGQLRKERTVEQVEWILARLFPEVNPVHIENHTGKEGRGKGCVWVYVSNAQDEAKLLTLNKRMFADVDDNLNEGIWYCKPEIKESLNKLSNDHAYKAGRPSVLPRQPLVAERPATRPAPPSKGSNKQSRPEYTNQWQRAMQQGESDATAEQLWEGESTSTSTPSFATHTSRQQAARPAYRQSQNNNCHNCRGAKNPQYRQQSAPQFHYRPNTINVYDYNVETQQAQYQQQQQQQLNHQRQVQQQWVHNPYGCNVVGYDNSNYGYDNSNSYYNNQYYDQQQYDNNNCHASSIPVYGSDSQDSHHGPSSFTSEEMTSSHSGAEQSFHTDPNAEPMLGGGQW